MVQQTSLEAYYNIIPRSLGLLQRKVYAVIQQAEPISNSMISKYADIPINIVTPRVYELRKLGLIVEAKKDYCEITGKKVMYWRVA